MKKILGLDIGVSSVGLAIVTGNEEKKIEKLAVRVIPEDIDFHGKFYTGNTASKNLARTEKRGIRRNNQRFKQRRDKLYRLLESHQMFPSQNLFELKTLGLYEIRAKAVSEQITLEELGRVLILLNQRRGFLSNKKSNSDEESSTEYKERIKQLESDLNGKTIGQKIYQELLNTPYVHAITIRERTYLRKTYLEEFDRIWDTQQKYYPDILTGNLDDDNIKGSLYDSIRNKTIYFQRPLKSQKGLVSTCLFEKHHRAITKTSPYFEIFRIWQRLNDLNWKTSDGKTHYPSQEQKDELFQQLFYHVEPKSKYKLTVSKIKKVLGYGTREKIYLNFTELDGSRTYTILKKALLDAEVNNPEQYLFFSPFEKDEKGGLFELWHITYSLPTENEIKNALIKRFHFNETQASLIASTINYNSDYGSLSTRAIKKILPYLQKGMPYSDACNQVDYDHSGYKTKIELQEKLSPISPNQLRNPVVEQVLNQVVNMVNIAIDEHGPFDEVRVELARELRNSAKTRKTITQKNARNKKENEKIRKKLKEEYGYSIVNGRDVKRYTLWEESNKKCLYCDQLISKHDFLHGLAEIEHILPKSRSFNNAMSNFMLAHQKCNANKGQMTAYDFMESKGEAYLDAYIEKVNDLYDNGSNKARISKTKFDNLMCKGEDIPSDFVERMKKDSQYIALSAVKILKTICENTYTTTGQVTDLLRKEWGLKQLLQDINYHKYEAIDQIETKQIKVKDNQPKTITVIKDWSKRDDHRHHAVDALICALTDQKIIFKLNNLNKLYHYHRDAMSKEELDAFEKVNEGKFDLKEFVDQSAYEFDCPIPNIRKETKSHLENIFISFKKNNGKVLTPSINPANEQKCWTPRGRLHEETVMGQAKIIEKNTVKLTPNFQQTNAIAHPQLKKIIEDHLHQHNQNPKIAFSKKTLQKTPLLFKEKEITEVPVFVDIHTKRVTLATITPKQIQEITDKKTQSIVEKRYLESGEDSKKAFGNLDTQPLWLNEEKGIQIKRVTVRDNSKTIATTIKRDHFGQEINTNESNIPTNHVITGGNHHALVYKTDEDKYAVKVISFWDAVAIGLVNIEGSGKPYPIINRQDDPELGSFLYSMQINDLFVLDLKHSKQPQEENEIDFYDPKNREKVSQHLFRVQKMSPSGNSIDVFLRHHLETTVSRDKKELRGITWERLSSTKSLSRLTKIKTNHLGNLIKIGE